jgi:hypothetical protein
MEAVLSKGVSTTSGQRKSKWSWTMFPPMERTLMTEHMKVLLEGRVVISSLAQMVARIKELDQRYYMISVPVIHFVS